MTGKKSKSVEKKYIKENDYGLTIANYLGSALVFFGIVYFIFVNWTELSNASKLLCTLGVAILAFATSVFLQIQKKYLSASSAFFLLAGLALPTGLNVLSDVLGFTWSAAATYSLISAICLCLFAYSYLKLKQTILLILTLAFASILFISLVNFLASFIAIDFSNISQCELIVLGLAYIYLGYRLQKTKYAFFTGPLYFIGCVFALDGAYFLGPISVTEPHFIYWKIIAALFIILAFTAAVRLKSKSFLYLGGIYFFLFLMTISRYFAQVLGNYGWPLFLVIVGLAFIVASYFIFYLRKKVQR